MKFHFHLRSIMTKLIAEIGRNHMANLNIAEKMRIKAKESGASNSNQYDPFPVDNSDKPTCELKNLRKSSQGQRASKIEIFLTAGKLG